MEKRNIHIIVEGPDRTGKSTLIQNLKNHFNDLTLHTLHYSNVKQNTPYSTIEYSTKLYTEMFGLMTEQQRYENTGIICDRSHLGEMVYGPLYRRYAGTYVLDIEKKFSNNFTLWGNLFLVTLYDEPENLVSRDDGLSFSTDIEKKKTEVNLFKCAHFDSIIKNKLLLNIKDHDAEQVLEEVIKFIEESK